MIKPAATTALRIASPHISRPIAWPEARTLLICPQALGGAVRFALTTEYLAGILR